MSGSCWLVGLDVDLPRRSPTMWCLGMEMFSGNVLKIIGGNDKKIIGGNMLKIVTDSVLKIVSGSVLVLRRRGESAVLGRRKNRLEGLAVFGRDDFINLDVFGIIFLIYFGVINDDLYNCRY